MFSTSSAQCCLEWQSPSSVHLHASCALRPDPGHACDTVAVEPADNDTIQYISHRQSKEYYDDGRRRNLFYLMDQHGIEHLAVVGEERETRDGHYTYSTHAPFNNMRPLQCYNQTGVYHWLESMLNHHLPRGTQLPGSCHCCCLGLAILHGHQGP
jgi:hypothetical protein